MKLTKSQIKELIRHSIRELTSEIQDVNESVKRRFTVKEVRMWMKKLEENRYKKVYNSDARRVAWMVNNEGVSLDDMPISMKKKWTKAQYGRERYLATEFLKSKSEQMNEGKLTEDYKNSEWEVYLKDEKGREKIVKKAKSKRAATILYNRIVKSDDYYEVGMRAIKEGKFEEQIIRKSIREIIEEMDESLDFGKVMDKYNKNIVDSALSMSKKHAIKDKQRGSKQTPKLIAIKTINRMKEYRNKTKGDLKLMFQKTIDKLEKDYKKIKEQMNEKSFGDIRKIKFDKSDGKKIVNIITGKKYKLTKPLYKIKGKDIELHIPKKEYNKAVEFFMKNKLNPRG